MGNGIPFDPRRIVFLRFGGIGEILAITPALVAIRRRWPRAKITAMVPARGWEILERLGVADEHLPADRVYAAARPRAFGKPRFWRELAGWLRRLRRLRPDLLLVFNHLYYHRSALKPLLATLASRAPVRVGFDYRGRGWFLTHRVPDPRFAPRHIIERNGEFLAALGIAPEDLRLRIAVWDADRREAAALMAEHGLDDGAPLLVVNPGSSRAASRWPAERFAETIRCLRVRYDLAPVLVGTRSEQSLCADVARRAGGACAIVAGRTSLHGLAALLERARLAISNDTGTVWIAAAVGTPVVAIFGPGEFAIWGTWRDPAFRAVRHPVECSPCLRKVCDHHTCMRMIEPSQVLMAASGLLRRTLQAT